MKVKAIKFFSPKENAPAQAAAVKAKPVVTGYVSATGKLVFPNAALQELGIEAESAHFKIGTDQGKRKIKSLYLIPAADESGAFALERSGRGYVIPLSIILKKGGVDFESTKYIFNASLFNYAEGVVGFQLELISTEPKPVYTGKPRGPKRRQEVVEG